MIYRSAAADDAADMLRLIESHYSSGGIELLYTRRPDAYKSYQTECPDCEITLCVNKNNRVLAQVVCMPKKVYIDGTVQRLGYVTGLHKEKDTYINLLKLLEAAHTRSVVKKHYCSILDENKAAYDLLAKRGSIHPICDYTTYIINPAAFKHPKHSFKFRRANLTDTDRLLAFYNDVGSGYSYFPVFETMDDFSGLTVTDFFVMEDGGEIVAAGALWNQQFYKQYIALGYHGIYKLAAYCNPLLRFLSYPLLPKINKAANIAFISFALCRKDYSDLLGALLGELAAAGRGYDFLTIGAVNGDEAAVILNATKGIRIGSKLCVTDYDKTGHLPIYKTPPRFECALL